MDGQPAFPAKLRCPGTDGELEAPEPHKALTGPPEFPSMDRLCEMIDEHFMCGFGSCGEPMGDE
jgi:hypothetical protein